MSECDIQIVNGSIIDGTGKPPYRANLAISSGKIVDISDQLIPARSRIDASGKYVTPGFIDLHSHADYSIIGSPKAESILTQGVTTLVTGNCGFSPFPVVSVDMMREASGIMDNENMSYQWDDLVGYRKAVSAAKPGVNIAPQVGHNALRAAALGMENRPATPDELAVMVTLLDTALRQGAFGLSTGLIYTPGVFADNFELLQLAQKVAEHGALYSTHMRSETGELLSAIAETLQVGRETGVRLEISHLKAMGPENHGSVVDAVAQIEAAIAAGVDVATDVYPYTASSTTLTSRIAPWAMDGGPKQLQIRLANPEMRARIAAELSARFGHDIDPAGVIVSNLHPGKYQWAIGQSLVDIGRRDGCDPAEAALRVLEAHDCIVPIINHSMAEADVEFVLQYENTSVASDGWILDFQTDGTPHPRNFGTFPRVLGGYVRERNIISFVDAIRKMTSLPASRIGLNTRGRLAPGMVADTVVLDPARVHDRATYTDPKQRSVGIDEVIISGEFAVTCGELTANRSGKVLVRQN